MFQIRIHGRGGQGVVTAAEVLSMAAFDEGRHAQAFPSFGSERMGAPVVAFCRIDERPIRSREPVMEPDALIIQDVTLVHQVDLFAGVSPEAYVLVNTTRSLDALGLGEVARHLHPERLRNCPATEIALAEIGRPVPNAALIAGFAALTGQISLASVEQALRQRFPGPMGERNVAAADAAYHYVMQPQVEQAHAATD
ncbi:MAG: 2-oxoacid:acceptor oxidoreductase family protein [Acidimicrobiales bacterium]|jgi:pyruvate ferredoxin oxidoreductase gamma subunit